LILTIFDVNLKFLWKKLEWRNQSSHPFLDGSDGKDP